MCIVKAKKIGWVLGSIALLLLLGLASATTQGAAGYAGVSSPHGYPSANSTVVDMRTFKTDGTYWVVPGTTITYTIEITNAGTITVNNLFLQEFPLDGLGSDYVTPIGGSGWKLILTDLSWWEYPDDLLGLTLSPDETMTVTFTVELASDAPYGGQLINKVQLTDIPDETSPWDNWYLDTDIVVPGFNFSYLPLVTKAYAP